MNLALDFAAAIAGTVVDQDAKPVEGVYVRFAMGDDSGGAVTDAHGAFVCAAMTGGGDYTATVIPKGRSAKQLHPASGAFPVVHLADGGSRVEDVRLAIQFEPLDVIGRVIDQNGAPIADAHVVAWASDMGRQYISGFELPDATTDAKGAFTIRDLVSGSYSLQAESADGNRAVVNGVAAGAKDVTIRLVSTNGIDVTVVGFKDAPQVLAQSMSNGGGMAVGVREGDAFHLRGLSPGVYLVTALSHGEMAIARVELQAVALASVTLTGRASATISATIVEFGSTTPVGAAHECYLIPRLGDQVAYAAMSWSSRVQPDEHGRLTIDPAPSGDLVLWCNSFDPAHSGAIASFSAAPNEHADVTLYSVTRTSDAGDGTIGVSFDYTDMLEARVSEVLPNSPAARAGIAKGDRVVAVDGVMVDNLGEHGVSALIANHAIGTTVALSVARSSGTKTVLMVVESAPSR